MTDRKSNLAVAWGPRSGEVPRLADSGMAVVNGPAFSPASDSCM